MATEQLVVPGLRLEWHWDRWNGWEVVAWKPHVSMVFRDRAELLRFIRWPVSTPTGQVIRGWIDAQIASVTTAQPEPEQAEPEPNDNTRMVI